MSAPVTRIGHSGGPALVEKTIRFQPMHPGQKSILRQKRDARGGAWDANAGGRFRAARCGRRFGKTELGKTWIADGAIRGEEVAWFAPQNKIMREVYKQLVELLAPVTVGKSQTDGVIRLLGGGRIDFWSLEDTDAGRSRRYHRIVMDEAAFTKPIVTMETWERSIKPTLLDFQGRALVISNTRGVNPDNFLWRICNEPEHGFIEYHAPSWANPTIPKRLKRESEADWQIRSKAIYDGLRAKEDPRVFAQEYGAEFISWDGAAFFSLDKLLVNGGGVGVPERCDVVFATVDTAVKSGSGNDGTAVTYWARDMYAENGLIMLDWDIVQIDGDLLEGWLAGVYENLEAWARRCGARRGTLGAFIEDRQTGSILIMASQRRGLPAHAVPEVLTGAGKDGRAIAISGYHYQGMVKMTHEAYEKTTIYKGRSANHMVRQLVNYKIGMKDQADDLMDTYCYGVAIALGDQDGI